MNFKDYLSKQAENPSGIFGRFVMAYLFDYGNASLNNLMKQAISFKENEHLLEIGFGTGRLVFELAHTVNIGFIEGIDISETMVSIAKKRNKTNIKNGKVVLKAGDFDEMPCELNRFDKIYTVNTIYFWPEPARSLKKIFEILKPQGMVLIAFEDETVILNKSLSQEIFRCYSTETIIDLIKEAGFYNTRLITTRVKDIIYHCAVGVKA